MCCSCCSWLTPEREGAPPVTDPTTPPLPFILLFGLLLLARPGRGREGALDAALNDVGGNPTPEILSEEEVKPAEKPPPPPPLTEPLVLMLATPAPAARGREGE